MLLQATAKLRYVSIPPRKMRLVANMVKGLPIEKALNILNFTPRIAAYHLAKTLKSAAANALSLEGTDQLRPEDLFVKNITVDSAPTAKRIRFQSMGRIYRYRKRFCHLTVVLEEKAEVHKERVEEAVKATSKKTAVKKPKKAAPKKRSTAKTDTKAKKAATKKQKVI
jgi:large subunit ribosomal protein L22